MIEFIKEFLNCLTFKPIEHVLPDGKKVYIINGGDPISTVIFERSN